MEMSFSMRHGRRLGIVALAAAALILSACGGKEEAPPAPPPAASAPAAPPPAAPEPAPAEDESVVVSPTLVDTLSTEELLTRADQAMKENQLFVPAGESAFEMYLRVNELEPEQITARNALTDLFPYAVLYVEQRTAAGDDGDAAVAARLCLRLVSPVHHPRHRRRRAAARQSGACRAA